MKKIEKQKFLEIASFVYIVLIISSNVMALKVINIIGFTVDAGTLTYPITFMIGDLLAELYGFKTAKKIILLGFFANFLFVVFTFLGVWIPALDSADTFAQSYDTLFFYSPRILLASFAAYIVGALLNASSLISLKKITGERLMWIRTIGSTALGAFVDTAMFTFLAWYGEKRIVDMLAMFWSSYVMKMIFETIIATPLDYAFVPFVKKYVKE